MADKQYDASPNLIRLFKEKEKIRAAVRQKVMLREHSPYINSADVIDPAIIRYHSALTYRPEFMYSKPKNVFPFIAFIILPVVFTYVVYRNQYWKLEELYRSGKVPYSKRFFYQAL